MVPGTNSVAHRRRSCPVPVGEARRRQNRTPKQLPPTDYIREPPAWDSFWLKWKRVGRSLRRPVSGSWPQPILPHVCGNVRKAAVYPYIPR